MRTTMTTTRGLLVWAALIALSVLGLVTGWSQAFLGWALNSLAEMTIPGYGEWKAQ